MSFTKLDPTDFVVSADSVTAPAWSTNSPTLSTQLAYGIGFYTASSIVSPGTSSYYLDVYQTNYTGSAAAVQFSIAYGHQYGSGSAPLNSLVLQNTPSRITFGQYRNLIYGDAESAVNFGTGNTASVDLVAIPIDRNRYKGNLFPGTFNLQLAYGSGSRMLHLTDNSKDVSTVTYLDCGRAYDIVSGSDGTSANAVAIPGVTRGYTASGSYGLFLPDIGVIVFNPKALQARPTEGGLGFNFNATSTAALGWQNHDLIYQIINSGSAAGSPYSGFMLNSQETISSDYVFVRIKNGEYNYTSNPSFISGSGNLIYSNFINSPQTYMTTVGMYNNNNELLAVAKLSKPLVKDFTKEALIRVKLDW
jgi:hypothetical protein